MQRNWTTLNWGRFLPGLLILTGAGITAFALTADWLNLGGLPGIGPQQVALAVSGFAVLLAGVVLSLSISWRYLGEWLVVGSAVFAVAFAAELVVINGLPEFAAKHIVLASVGLSVLAIGAVPAATADRPGLGQWLNPSALRTSELGKFLGLAAQLGLLVLVVQQFHLENQAVYQNFMLVTFYGFLIHSLLPVRYRLLFFLLLSLATIAGILNVTNSAWLLGIGLGLIGLCHLPIAYGARIALLLAATAALVVFRVGWIRMPGLDVIWPVLASMFMFRLIIYVYDLKHGKAKPTLTSTLTYFFLLPNVVFPFFPVVDYSTFRRTYYDDNEYHIYQKGLQWMLRGVIQLIVYRYINYYLVTAPQDVTTTPELIQFLIANFGLYVRISGQFHLIIGSLHLFGFNLPETHHLYFLASSFTDLWRRINIYWKDFMLKVFFYPAYFRIKHWGPAASLTGATVFVFFMTWFLHAYQWFWLRGKFLFTAQDILFWFILATLVVINTLADARRARKRNLGRPASPAAELAGQALRSAGTFTVMAVLWSLWSSASLADWIALLSVVQPNAADVATLLLTFLVITALFGVTIWIGTRRDKSGGPGPKRAPDFRTAAVTGGALGLLLLIGNPGVYGQLGGRAQALISDLTVNRLSDVEATLLQRGYYEDLVGVSGFNSQLWEIYTKRPSDWPTIMETEVARPTGDNLIVELVPSKTITFLGAKLSTNRWGMRDRDYELTPAPSTYRIALTGPSFVMGSGVADEEVFEWLLEDRLNEEFAGSLFDRYEILNFAVPGYSALQELLSLEQKGLAFQPDAIFFVAHQREEEAVVRYLADRIAVRAELPYDDLMGLAQQTGAAAGQTKVEIERRLNPVGTELLSRTYQHIVAVARANGILPVYIFMPTLENPLHAEEVERLTHLAEAAGFIVLDLSEAYANQDEASIVVAYWDKHPNAKGHQLIAEHLYQALWQKKEAIPIFP